MPSTIASIVFFALFLYSTLLAQDHIRFNHLTVDDGLSQSAVTTILQDSKGFMWFGTQDGLNRYDGYEFKIYKNSPGDSLSLRENFVFSIFENAEGVLYIETQGGIWHRFDAKNEHFKVIDGKNLDLGGMRGNTVRAALYEENGNVWKGGLGQPVGLTITSPQNKETKTFRHDPDDPASLSDDKVYSVLRDRAGDLWIATFGGLDKLDEDSGNFSHFRNDANDPLSLPDNWVWPIFEDSRGNLWIGTVRSGLCRFDKSSGSFTTYQNDPDDPTSINDNFIFSIYEDRAGLIWVGTNQGGINYFNPSARAFEHYKHDPKNPNSLSDNDIISLLADSNGNYWAGTRNGGLNRFNYTKKKFSHYKNDPLNPNSILSNSIVSLFEDRTGVIWIGTFSSGLDAFNPKTNTFTHYTHNPNDSASLSDNRVYAIAEGRGEIIWIGTYGGGLNRLDRRNGDITRFTARENDAEALSSNATWSLANDGDRLWVGTFGGGLNVFDKKTQKFRHYKNIPEDSTSISDDNIITVFKDSKGTIWAGSTKGFSKYQPASNNFINYTEADGLTNSFVYGIVEDNNGHLWLSTNNGLSRFDPQTESFKNYYYKDGLQSNEFNQNAFAKDPNTANLLFGGANGFNVFNPDSLKPNTYIPPIAFTKFLHYNTDDEEGKPILENGISERDSIFLSYKDNIISLEFAALSFHNNLENRYRYRLEGFNENWIQLENNRTVTFTNLSPGSYELRVLGSNNDNIWNEQGRSLNILISPPWWETKIAYAAYFIIFFGALYVIRRVEINRREQKAQIRESALRVKAAEAEKRVLQIENERKTKELEEARALQLSMLPKELPALPHLEIAAYMRTATEVGGDYYDFITKGNDLYVAFGDATGHGLQAGTMVTLMKGFFTSDSSKLGLKEFMSHCSSVIKEIKLGRILMSFSYLKIEGKKLQLTSAGMPPLFYYNSNNGGIEEILIQGMPLGAMRNAKYQSTEMELKSGDVLLLMSDGLPEQMNHNDEMFDYSRVKDHFNAQVKEKPNEIIQKLVQAGDAWMNGRSQDDDITFVIIKVK